MSRRLATSDAFSAIAEPRRRQIIELLARRGNLAVGAIVLALGLPQPVISKHLGVLREVGIVSVTKLGQKREYALNFHNLRPVHDWIQAFEQHWDRQLTRIQARAEQRARARSQPSSSVDNKKGTS